ncbi:MAG: hypothetical protein FWE31_04280 [Firmicutes bacterium]|nr:hypothetical protein [Bacillota bacterium]
MSNARRIEDFFTRENFSIEEFVSHLQDLEIEDHVHYFGNATATIYACSANLSNPNLTDEQRQEKQERVARYQAALEKVQESADRKDFDIQGYIKMMEDWMEEANQRAGTNRSEKVTETKFVESSQPSEKRRKFSLKSVIEKLIGE